MVRTDGHMHTHTPNDVATMPRSPQMDSTKNSVH